MMLYLFVHVCIYMYMDLRSCRIGPAKKWECSARISMELGRRSRCLVYTSFTNRVEKHSVKLGTYICICIYIYRHAYTYIYTFAHITEVLHFVGNDKVSLEKLVDFCSAAVSGHKLLMSDWATGYLLLGAVV